MSETLTSTERAPDLEGRCFNKITLFWEKPPKLKTFVVAALVSVQRARVNREHVHLSPSKAELCLEAPSELESAHVQAHEVNRQDSTLT